jgi:hypothetical protein
MIGLIKGVRIILLTVVAGLIGTCIGRAPAIGPGTTWVSFLWVTAGLAFILIILEVCDRTAGAPVPQTPTEGHSPATPAQSGELAAMISGEVKVKLKPTPRANA